MSDSVNVSPAVEAAMKKFHERIAERKEQDDDDLAERIRRIVNERDELFHVASEMLSTILLERNRAFISPELRQLAETGWLKRIEAIGAGRELTPDELDLALTASGIDIAKGYERLRAAIEKHRLTPAS